MRKHSLKALLFVLVASLVLCLVTACEVVPEKTKLEAPTLAEKVYTGSKLTATIAESEGYTVVTNEGGTDVGEYEVVLKLSDETKYEWATPDADDATKVTLKFAITKATNEITVLTLDGWTFGQDANTPTATAMFGTPTFTYGATADGEFSETVPTAAGNYFVKATVAATANYDGAEKTAEFKIARASAALTTTPQAVTNLVYTGGALDLVTAGVANGGTMQYKLGTDGTWSSDIPTATNAGEYTVYYKVLGDDSHSDIAEASVTVTIAKANSTFGKLPQDPDLHYTGEMQALLVAGETACGKIWYKLGDGEWTVEIPSATDAKTYDVYYKIVGDGNHNDLINDETQKISVTIARVNAVVTAPTAKSDLTYNGEAQALVNAGSANGATIEYKLDNGEWTKDVPSATNAGAYKLTYKVIADANHTGDSEQTIEVTIAKIADSIDFSLNGVTVHCGEAIPDLEATATSGAAVTFTYSDNGKDYYTKEQLVDFVFTYGTTYYVKATVADSTNYTGVETIQSITPQHKIVTSEKDGVQTAECPCGKKDVTGTLGTKQTIDLAATVENGEVKATDGKLDLTTIGYTGNAAVTLTVDETAYQAMAQNGVVALTDVLPLGIYGEKSFAVSVTDGKETYNITINALVVTMTITSADQYANWITVAKACEQSATLWGGYFRLGANITATSMVMFNRGKIDGTEGFKGVFDGCGYIIDGLNRSSWDSNAFVTTMTKTGVLKNIAFTDVKITGEGNFLTSGGKGTIENVFVQYTVISVGDNNGNSATIANQQDGCAMRNVFVDASKAVVSGSGAKFRILTNNTKSGFGGVFGVCPSQNYTPSQALGRDINYSAIAFFANFAELKANDTTQTVLAGWNNNGFWTVNDGIPAPAKLVVTELNLGAQDINLDILVDNDNVTLNDNNVEIDCTAVGFSFGEIASATMEGASLDVSKFAFADGKLIVVRSVFGYNYGAKEIVVTDVDNKTITIAATLVSKVLTDATDYLNWIKIANACEAEDKILGGYFKLGANIASETMVTFYRHDVDGAYGFKGVFDGCGYAIDGLTATGNAFISCMTKDGVLRNIAFTNAKLAGESNFLCSGGLGTIENVYVQYVSIAAGSDYNGTIFNNCRDEKKVVGRITNVFVDASNAVISGSGSSFRLIGGSNNGYNGIFAVCPEGYTVTQARDTGSFAAHAVCAFASFDELKDSDKMQTALKGWDSTYWTIVEGVPTFVIK